MSATTNNTTTTGYVDKVVTTDLAILDQAGTADSGASYGQIRTRLRLDGATLTATTDVTIEQDTATGKAQIDEMCEDAIAHFTAVKAAAAALMA